MILDEFFGFGKTEEEKQQEYKQQWLEWYREDKAAAKIAYNRLKKGQATEIKPIYFVFVPITEKMAIKCAMSEYGKLAAKSCIEENYTENGEKVKEFFEGKNIGLLQFDNDSYYGYLYCSNNKKWYKSGETINLGKPLQFAKWSKEVKQEEIEKMYDNWCEPNEI